MAIGSFRDRRTADLFSGKKVRAFAPIERAALRKLTMLHAARTLDELRSPPGNRLESLRGDRKGQHSIRINDRFRLCFVWRDGTAEDVEIVDYH